MAQLHDVALIGGLISRAVLGRTRRGRGKARIHDLRDTAATLMLANNVHPKIMQERLGHSDVGITLNRYIHVTMDMQREAADRLDSMLG